MIGGFYTIPDISGSVDREDSVDIYDVKYTQYQNMVIKWKLAMWKREDLSVTPNFQD